MLRFNFTKNITNKQSKQNTPFFLFLASTKQSRSQRHEGKNPYPACGKPILRLRLVLAKSARYKYVYFLTMAILITLSRLRYISGDGWERGPGNEVDKSLFRRPQRNG